MPVVPVTRRDLPSGAAELALCNPRSCCIVDERSRAHAQVTGCPLCDRVIVPPRGHLVITRDDIINFCVQRPSDAPRHQDFADAAATCLRNLRG